MEDTEDKFFNGYLKRNLAKIVTKVKVREIVSHLPSLTQSDRESIEAKRESTGNYNAMQLLLSCLRRGDNWLEEFISGLQTCEHSALASQIREEYETQKIQPDGSVLAPLTPKSGGTLQAPLNPNGVSNPKIEEVADLATSVLIKATSDEILANHTGLLSAVVPSQSLPEPAASLQTHTSEDTAAVPSIILVTPATPTSSPAVPPPSPQAPFVKLIQDTSPPDKKLHYGSDNPTDGTKSTFGQVLAEVTASLNVQDVTDGFTSTSCAGGASASDEMCSNKPVLLTSIHSVQVHQPFDSPSTFPSIQDDGTYSVDSINQECSSTMSHHTFESVNAESTTISDAENVAFSETQKVAFDHEERVVLGDSGGVPPGHTESGALSDSAKVAPEVVKNMAASDTERVVSTNIESVALSDVQRVAPGHAECVTFSEKEAVMSHKTDNVLSGDMKSTTGNEVSSLPENKNTSSLSNEDGIVPGNTESIAPGNRENVVADNNEKAERLVGDNTETIVCDELKSTSLEDIESTAVKDCDTTHHDFTTSNHNPASVIHDHVGPSNMQNRAADSMETTASCSMESGTHLCQNVLMKSDYDVAHQEISSLYAPPSNYNSESYFPGETDNGVSGEGESGALSGRDSGTTNEGDSRVDSGVPAEGHSEASSEDDSDDTESEAPGEEDNGASGNTDDEAPGGGDCGASSYKDREGGSGLPGDTDSGAPGNGDGGASGEGDAGSPEEKDNGALGGGWLSCQAAGEDNSQRRQEEDNGKSADRLSGSPGKGDSVIPGEGGSKEQEVRNNWLPGEGESCGTADSDKPGDMDSGTPNELGIVVPKCTELLQENPEENQDSNHLTINFPASSFNHIPKSIVLSDMERETPNEVQNTSQDHLKIVVHTEPTHTELVENQCKSTHLEISFPSSTLSKNIPESVVPKDMEGMTPGNTHSVHFETEENHCSGAHLSIGLSSAGSSIPSTDSASPNNMGNGSPGDAFSPNKQPPQHHCSFTHQTISLTSTASLNHKPDSAAHRDIESCANKPTKNLCSAPFHDITAEQDVKKEEPCSSEDLAVQNLSTSAETPVGVIAEKGLEAFPEQSQPRSRITAGNYYVPAAMAGVVAAAVLWQLKK